MMGGEDANSSIEARLLLLDQLYGSKIDEQEFMTRAQALGVPTHGAYSAIGLRGIQGGVLELNANFASMMRQNFNASIVEQDVMPLCYAIENAGIVDSCVWDSRIVRGLAYYTGTVFEVHEATGAERAIAGGGRYDNLVELFGGPATPAVGFAMGDVVLSLILQDKGLMPSDAEIAKELRLDPDVFVFSVDESLDAHAASFLALCRREGMHARRSYKTTRNVGKLLKEASAQRARVAAFVEPSPDGHGVRFQVKDLSGGRDQQDFPGADAALAFIHAL